MTTPKPPAETGSTREAAPEGTATRRTIGLAVIGGACVFAATAAVPALVFVAAPLAKKGGESRWVRTVRLEQLAEGEPKRVAVIDDRTDAWTRERGVDLGSVWLVRQGANVLALSAVCPHLGCSVNTAPVIKDGFACPCHTSAFDLEGRRTSGPSPRNMDTLATRIDDGVVVVDFQRFRIGVPEKVRL
ncbi:Menaquinone-cytochrome C reductase iron-sulfur subunit [Labilithrix luteola]|uniref:Menaquinone-cytochrome C reductase iron-sulfur subunit n=1 Tax=Labilithrix luteola TaxID=1391654 RepID=A0A0K1Q0K6_9BACT|nr:Rieske (2Fe-2S) protein [Labilithrix luteola]AKU98944.1 Menaquinone-cytochrome C reductase iron-sulfur subunit [Labilithrix luteola]